MKLIRRSDLETTVDRIVMANGGQNAITATLASLCKPGDCIGADPHTYPGLKTASAMLSIHIVPIKSENDVIRGQGIAKISIDKMGELVVKINEKESR